MVTTQIWGNALWIFLHTFNTKIHESFFIQNKHQIMSLIYELMYNIPCHICREHALQYMKTNNIHQVHSKDALERYFFTFHNNVNQMKNRVLFTDYDIYKTYNLQKVISHFTIHFTFYRSNKMLFIQNKKRQEVGKRITDFINDNIHHFT